MIDLTPGSPEHTKRVTASKVAAILGVSPWQSPYSLWREMRGDVTRPESSTVQKRGHYLEPAILAWWRDQHPELGGWTDQPSYTLGEWAAATPDLAAHLSSPDGCDLDDEEACTEVLVEAKSVAYDDDWGPEGTDVIPAYYLVQVQWQMHVSGVHRCYVPIITSRLRFAEYVVDYDAETGPLLEARCREFYDSLSGDVPPALDDTVATFQTLKALHPDIDKGEAVELDHAAAIALTADAYCLKGAEARDRESRSRALEAMGRAQYATHNGVRVARRQPNKYGVSLVITAKPADLTDMEASA